MIYLFCNKFKTKLLYIISTLKSSEFVKCKKGFQFSWQVLYIYYINTFKKYLYLYLNITLGTEFELSIINTITYNIL